MPTVHLPDELADRLAAEAVRREVSLDELAAETLADRSPPAGVEPKDALEAFIGCGSSGRRQSLDIHQARAELAQRRATETI